MSKPNLLCAALATLIIAGPVTAQAPAPSPSSAPMFPFVIPWDDATPATATDVSFLNTKPAGAHGDIVSKGGHFLETGTGRRVRFLGTNFAAWAAFPSHDDAEKVASRVAKLGINLVRLHHMDNDNWGAGATIWDTTRPDRQHINPAQLDRLDYLISQFKKNGVYVNINLHVSRQLSEADGFPPSVNQITTSFDKRVDKFDRRMIQLQKNYAHDLLTHVNPYTHLSYTQDPCVAVVEINNENSLVGDPWATLGADLDTLPEPFRGELVALWNTWLTKQYGTDAKLQAAWLKGTTPPGLSLDMTADWSLEHQGASDANLTHSVDPNSAVQINVTKVDGTDWHVQAHETGIDFKEGQTYTVSFRAKADTPRTMNVNAGLDQNDWHNIGLSENSKLTTDWQTFRYTFDAHDVAPSHGRVAFVLGNQTGTVSIADLQVKPGAEGAGLQPGQSLATKTVDIPTSATRPQHADWIAFLADTERAYTDEMRGYLKNTLHVHANVIDTQISWGGLTGIYREAGSDFADNHAYWQHPSFPHTPWDSKDWNIPNTSMLADLANGGGGTLRDLAEYRVAGKPYTVSEYNEPAPNDFQAETVPLLATFAAEQDWDAVYLFDYGDYGTGKANDKIGGYFGIGSNPAKTAFLPAAAMIFRAGELPPATSSVTLSLPPHLLRDGTVASKAWGAWPQQNAVLTSGRRWQIKEAPSAVQPVPVVITGLPQEAGPRLQLLKPATGPQYIAVSNKSVTVIGYVGVQTNPNIKAGPVSLSFSPFGNGFAALTLTAMDDKPLTQSKRMLLTLAGKVENQGMVWNATRTSVGDQWGQGPTVAEGISATVDLQGLSGSYKMYALDGNGKRTAEVPPSGFVAGKASRPEFRVGPEYKTLWYEIVR